MTVATESNVSITDLYFDLNIWLNEFKFYKDEIRIFNRRLEEIVKRNTGREILRQVEHFQNQYIRQLEVIDLLRHDVKQRENVLERQARDNAYAEAHSEDHYRLREQAEQFRKIYTDLKREFMAFLSRQL